MNAVYLVDTVIIIDHFNRVGAATDWLESEGRGKSAISVVTRAEVLTGIEDNERELVEKLLGSFACLTITAETADMAADLRRQHGWKLPDAFQAALAIANGLKLVTRNTKNFPPDKHSFVFVPYTL